MPQEHRLDLDIDVDIELSHQARRCTRRSKLKPLSRKTGHYTDRQVTLYRIYELPA